MVEHFIAGLGLLLVVSVGVTGCTSVADKAAPANPSVCEAAVEVGFDYFSEEGPVGPMRKIERAAGAGSEIEALASELGELLSPGGDLSDDDVDRLSELDDQLTDALATACPDLAECLDGQEPPMDEVAIKEIRECAGL